jgi:hypothetical protein
MFVDLEEKMVDNSHHCFAIVYVNDGMWWHANIIDGWS